MSTIKERLKEFIYAQGTTVQKFEKQCGMSNGYVNCLKKDGIGAIRLDVILRNYPNLNKDWLLYGEGDMYVDQSTKTIAPISTNAVAVYDIDATCGPNERPIDFTSESIVGYVHLPYLSGDTKIIRANGDSMTPTVKDGDWVAVREINSWDDIFYGQIYLVITDDYRMIKRIRRYEADETNKVILRSDNEGYDDMIFSRRKIRKLFVVVDILSVHKML